MKKVLGFILALTMVLALCVPAFAEEPATSGSTTQTKVPASGNASVVAGYEKPENNIVHNYKVTIAWTQEGSIQYAADKDTYTWDTAGLKYDKTVAEVDKAKWTITDAKVRITVTNSSDVEVTASCAEPATVADSGVKSITGSYDKSALTLKSAANGLTGTGAPVGDTATYSITAIDGAITAAGNIGTITVSLATAGN